MGAMGTIEGLPQPSFMSQSTTAMWSEAYFPKVSVLASNLGSYLSWRVLEMVRSLVYGE